MDRFLCFVHIERAGGTTLHRGLQNAFPAYHTVFPWYYWANDPEHAFFPDELASLMKVLPTCQGIGGHTTRPWLDYGAVARREVFWFTFLRDPIKRTLSHYNHQVQKMGIRWELDDFLGEPRFANWQVVRLAGREDLDEAKRVLERQMSFVGLTDAYDASLVMLGQVLGLTTPLHYERLNATPSPVDAARFDGLSRAQQERLREMVALDQSLYDWFLDGIWERQVAAFGDTLPDAVVAFQEANETFRYPPVRSRLLRAVHGAITRLVEPVIHQRRGVVPPPR